MTQEEKARIVVAMMKGERGQSLTPPATEWVDETLDTVMTAFQNAEAFLRIKPKFEGLVGVLPFPLVVEVRDIEQGFDWTPRYYAGLYENNVQTYPNGQDAQTQIGSVLERWPEVRIPVGTEVPWNIDGPPGPAWMVVRQRYFDLVAKEYKVTPALPISDHEWDQVANYTADKLVVSFRVEAQDVPEGVA